MSNGFEKEIKRDLKIWYGHIKKADFCTPNSVYVMIHSNIINNNYFLDNELVSINEIATKLGYSQGLGTRIKNANIQKLSSFLRKKLLLRGITDFDVDVGIDDDIIFNSAYSRIKQMQVVTVCFSFSIYREYFKNNKKEVPCLNTSDILNSSHCIVLFPISSDKVLLIDPNCHYFTSNNPESIAEFVAENSDKVFIMDLDEFKNKIFLARRDNMDVLNRQLIYTDIIPIAKQIKTMEKKDREQTTLEFFEEKEKEEKNIKYEGSLSGGDKKNE
ncbi:MAG: hypothetical protein ACP5IB_09785 [Thermoplasmata archaeon]